MAFPSSSSALLLGAFTRGAPCQPRGDSKSSLPAGLTVSSPRLCPACLPAPRPLRVRCLKMNSGSPTPTAPASLPGATVHSAAQAQTWCCAFSCLPVALCVAGSSRPRWLSAPQYLQSASSCPSARPGREPWTASSPPRRLCQGTARVTLEESCVCKSNQTCPSEDCGVLCCCVSTGNACPGVPGPVPASPSAPACGLPAPSSDRPHCPV